jgi:hypothetical protein
MPSLAVMLYVFSNLLFVLLLLLHAKVVCDAARAEGFDIQRTTKPALHRCTTNLIYYNA